MPQQDAQNLLRFFEHGQAVVTEASKAATKIHRKRKQKEREANDILREQTGSRAELENMRNGAPPRSSHSRPFGS
jgi:hypothetical protein